ncbi:MAG: single-stranded-DNA-specific exonuclease RecJ [Alphaproteobacteria bacterium BRH_c36]|nr:MAG: single-stranded-DNA-specific exonuclease RecJ [Alphaproteobacteria bacterium BRH_c36]
MGAARKLTDSEANQPAAFLGVTASVRGYEWRERLNGHGHAIAAAISQRHGLPDLLGRVLAGRGVGIDDVEVFLDPSLKALMPDPSELRDMDKAAGRLADAIAKTESVAIFGDYDVDGACSSALMARFLRQHGLEPRIYIPDRLSEGYGPNPKALEELVKGGAGLIVTVDCGTTSFEPLAHAKKLGAEVIVIDHHQSDDTLPDVHSVVNPNRQDDISGQGHLCAAGVVFLVLVATARELRKRGFYAGSRSEPALIGDLDLVALATVCDVVPLEGLNRAYVTKGLQVMRQRHNPGLRALYDAAGLDQAPTPYHLGYILGPRINAGGRIGDSGLGARLLGLANPREAQTIAETLDRLNRERKAIETQTLEQAMAEADGMLAQQPDLPILVLGAEDWHKGIVGLVSSRLTDRFHRPSCVLSWTRDAASGAMSGTGSLRSVNGVDIGRAVRAAVAKGLLIKGGGHAMAAGLTVAENKLEDLKAYLAAELAVASETARSAATLEIDGALTPSAANDDLITLLDRAGPYGQGNPQPRFVFPAHRVRFAKVVGEAHIRAVVEAGDGSRLDAIAFRAAGQPLGDLLLASNGGMPLHICGTIRRDTWGGRNRIELTIEDAAEPRKQA